VTQVGRFLISGGVINAIVLIFYVILVQIGFDPKSALTINYWLTVFFLFMSNKKLVFKHDGDSFNSLVKFVLVYLLGYFFTLVIVSIGLDFFALNYILSMFIASVIMPFYYYFMQKFLVFRPVSNK